jgi:hypothetical protein
MYIVGSINDESLVSIVSREYEFAGAVSVLPKLIFFLVIPYECVGLFSKLSSCGLNCQIYV